MFGSDIVDVGIGMAFLFFFMSMIATALREAIENVARTRARFLEKGITEMLRDPNDPSAAFVTEFYNHPAIASLFSGDYEAGGRHLPSYIPRENFSLALLDLITKASEQGSPLSVSGLRDTLLGTATPNPVQRVVLLALGTAGEDLAKVRTALEEWYDGTMDRVAGWYTRRTGVILAILGYAAAAFFNVDAVTVAQHLYRDKALRTAIVDQATAYVDKAGHPTTSAATQGDAEVSGKAGPSPSGLQTQPAVPEGPAAALTPSPQASAPSGATSASHLDKAKSPVDSFSTLRTQFESLGYPIGWHDLYPAPQFCGPSPNGKDGDRLDCGRNLDKLVVAGKIVSLLFGWAITALAIMLGAPFWFDVLNKFIVIRSTVKPKEKSPDEASPDARPSGPAVARSFGNPGDSHPDDEAQADTLAANVAVAHAMADRAFVPRAWANDTDTQAGVL